MIRRFDVAKLASAHDFGDRHAALRAWHVLELGTITQVFAHPHLGVKRYVLGKISNLAPDLERLVKHVVTGQRGASARGAQVRRQHPHRRRFAGTVGAEQTNDLTAPHFETDRFDRFDRAIAFRQPINMDHDNDVALWFLIQIGTDEMIPSYVTIIARPTGVTENTGEFPIGLPALRLACDPIDAPGMFLSRKLTRV